MRITGMAMVEKMRGVYAVNGTGMCCLPARAALKQLSVDKASCVCGGSKTLGLKSLLCRL